jgi:uncharacterized membrane protein YkgB
MSRGPGVGVGGEMFALIAASEIGTRIAEIIRNVVNTVFEIATPILTAIGIAEILTGLLLAVGFRQEYIGYRLVIGGVITLVFTYIVVPLLLPLM